MERLLENSGTRIWSTCNGQGSALILCNGGPGCDDYLGPVSAMIEDICQVIRFEPRGCGRSSRDNRYDLETTIDDVEFVRCAYGLGKIIVSGHSAGVDVALAYALKYPANTAGIIGISGGRIVNDREWSRVYHENLDKKGEDNGGRIFDADPEVNKTGNASWKKYITRPELLSDLSKMQMPAVFINAEADIRPNWPARQLAKLISRGDYIEIPGAGHCIWLSQPDTLRAELRAAVKKLKTAP